MLLLFYFKASSLIRMMPREAILVNFGKVFDDLSWIILLRVRIITASI